MDRRFVLGALGATALVTGGAALWRGQGSVPLPLPLTPANAQEAGGEAPEIIEMVLGDPEAPVELIEYASFTCPHCARFHAEILPGIKEQYIDTNRIRFVYRESYLDRPGLWASMMARCAGPLRYFGVVDILYETQTEWHNRQDLATTAENLRRIGRSVGLGEDELESCLTNGAFAQSLMDRYREFAREFGDFNSQIDDYVIPTPTLYLNGERLSGITGPGLAEQLETALANAGG